jgi:uncharacterized membrane protein
MKKFGRKLGGYLLQGIFVTAPIGVTAYIIYVVFTFLDGLLRRFLDPLLGVHIPGIGLLSIIVLITLLGYLTQTIVFRPVRKAMLRLMDKAPLLKVIYSAIRDLLSAFVGKEKKFTEPVLVLIHPPSNLEKLGFVTQTDLAVLGIREKRVAVYFPHSYNFSGELFIVPAENVRPVDLPSAEVMKFIVSGGVTHL